MDAIKIRGAAQHNLKNVSLNIPRDKFVIITGVSGSGKSSLAFDTIYAEGQRRYVESLSTYARQFIGQMDKPNVESIEGLSPAIAIEQRTASHNPRSTVGTVTEIYDYFRLLYTAIGVCHCYHCGREIKSQTIDGILESILSLPDNTFFSVLAPLVRGKKGEFQKELKKLQKEGFARVRIDGEIRDLAEDIVLKKNKRHDIDLVVDRLVLKEGVRKRLRDSLEIAISRSEGLVRIFTASGKELLFSEKYACPDCGISIPALTPRMFSFNSPYGACPDCNGLGSSMRFAEYLVVPDSGLSLRDGAIAPWAGRSSLYYHSMLDALSIHYGFDVNTPFNKLPEKIQKVLLYGSNNENIKFYHDRANKRYFTHRPFEGVIKQLTRRWQETTSSSVRNDLMSYIDLSACNTCQGARLKKEMLAVTVMDKNIYELCKMSIRECYNFFEQMNLSPQEKNITERIIREIKSRLQFLLNVGMDYLSLERTTSSLSGGESQRIRLATQIGSGLMGVLYVLDEPTIGLHQKDNLRLIDTLKRLRDMGNTVLVVEHDADMIRACDHIVDIGPGAGTDGGEIVFQGTPSEIMKNDISLTGRYLSGKESIAMPDKKRPVPERFIFLEGATENNLKNIDIKIPVGVFTAVTGVSGSGKSTMVIETLYKVLARRLNQYNGSMGKIKRVVDLGDIERVIMINQHPIGRTPRSNPATYTGVFSFIRDLFTNLPEARMRGYKPGRFSFNVKGGRCEACEGNGLIRIEMHFLPDVYVTCDACHGKRFNQDTLDIKYKDKNIADVLDMTVNQALVFFSNIPSIKSHLQLLGDVGLGYIHLGQSATTLSGGEAQRIKLARELGKKVNSNTLYILDEPTIGLHFADIQKLLDVLMRLVNMGNTMVVIEHNLDVIKCADYIIDLGPEGGSGGGRIIASGTAEGVAQDEKSTTGQFLRKVINI
ncbi:MAG: excinuclease ABC subunit UvrA [Syntrophaceae bacterium]|nr:excinuclease ABC subunit UvrA [Syntrophaceae bacterium]